MAQSAREAAGLPPSPPSAREAPAVSLHYRDHQWVLLKLSNCSGNVWGLAKHKTLFLKQLVFFPAFHLHGLFIWTKIESIWFTSLGLILHGMIFSETV